MANRQIKMSLEVLRKQWREELTNAALDKGGWPHIHFAILRPWCRYQTWVLLGHRCLWFSTLNFYWVGEDKTSIHFCIRHGFWCWRWCIFVRLMGSIMQHAAGYVENVFENRDKGCIWEVIVPLHYFMTREWREDGGSKLAWWENQSTWEYFHLVRIEKNLYDSLLLPSSLVTEGRRRGESRLVRIDVRKVGENKFPTLTWEWWE